MCRQSSEYVCRCSARAGVYVLSGFGILTSPVGLALVPLEGCWPQAKGLRAGSCSAIKLTALRASADLCLGLEILVALPTPLALLPLLGCTEAWGLAACELPVSCPSVSVRLGCISRPAWGCPLGGCLCFLSPSPGPAATAVPNVHPCCADPLA